MVNGRNDVLLGVVLLGLSRTPPKTPIDPGESHAPRSSDCSSSDVRGPWDRFHGIVWLPCAGEAARRRDLELEWSSGRRVMLNMLNISEPLHLCLDLSGFFPHLNTDCHHTCVSRTPQTTGYDASRSGGIRCASALCFTRAILARSDLKGQPVFDGCSLLRFLRRGNCRVPMHPLSSHATTLPEGFT